MIDQAYLLEEKKLSYRAIFNIEQLGHHETN